MTRTALTGSSPFADQYNRLLSAAYRWFYRLVDPDWALEQDPDTWRKIHRDPKFVQNKQYRLATMAGREYTLRPRAEKPTEADLLAASVCADGLDEIRDFAEARALMGNAVFQGSSNLFIEGRRMLMDLGNLGPRMWWVPTRLRHLEKERFQFVPKEISIGGRRQVVTELEVWDVAGMVYVPMTPTRLRSFVRTTYMDQESSLGYGTGLLSSLYFTWWWKQELLKEGLNGIERWAQGLVAVKVNWGEHAKAPGNTGKDPTAIRDEYLDALSEMRSRHQIVLGSEDDLIFPTASHEGNLVLDLIKYADDVMTGLVLGSVRPFGGGQSSGSGGSYALATVEADTSEILLALDRNKIEESITHQLIRQFWRLNSVNLASLGLARARMPAFKIASDRRSDPEVSARVVESLLRIPGFVLKREEVYEKTGFTEPNDKDDVLVGSAAIPSGPYSGGAPSGAPRAPVGQPPPPPIQERIPAAAY